MNRLWKCWHRYLGLVSALVLGGAIAPQDCTVAQNITLDGSLGPAETLTGPNYAIPQAVGQSVGSNLFHSFGQFNLNTGESAVFQSDATIQTIFSRVTGGLPSAIDGLIATDANVNLFFMNPSGIVFGPNASINVGSATRGAFVATSAAIAFGDRGAFFASGAQTDVSLLTIDPSAFLFNQIAAQSVTSQANLQVNVGQSLLLVGGDVSLNGGDLVAPGGRVELGGLGEPGSIGLGVNNNELRLSFPDGVSFADVALDNGAQVNVRAGGGGTIVINAENLNLAQGSSLEAGIELGLGSVGSQAGDIDIQAIGAVTLTNTSFIGNGVGRAMERGAVGNSGDINITTGSLSVLTGAFIGARTFGQGNAGNINIDIQESAVFDGERNGEVRSGVLSDVFFDAQGNSGDLNLRAGSLSLTRGARISASTQGIGNAGNVNIDVRGSAVFDGERNERLRSGAFSEVSSNSVGDGGDLTLRAGSLVLTNGAQVSASTFAQGNAGSVTLEIRDAVSLDGIGSAGSASGVFSTVGEDAVGRGGDIDITTRSLVLTNGAFVSASTFGKGDAGNIRIDARDTVSLEGVGSNNYSSALLTSSEEGASGRGGEIIVNTASFRVLDGAVVNAQTFSASNGGMITLDADTFEALRGGQVLTTTGSSGNAGSITLNITDWVTLSGSDPAYTERVAQAGTGVISNQGAASGLFANTAEASTGLGGGLTITTGRLLVQDGAQVSVSSQGTGDAGNLDVAARSIWLNDGGQLTAETQSGNGGDITLQVQDVLVLRRESQISTTAGRSGTGGNGGNITINTGFITATSSENSDISANAFEGRGGTINITAQGIFGIESRNALTPESDITASSELGVDGVVEINRPELDPSQGLAELSTDLVDPSNQIARNCQVDSEQVAQSAFVVTGRGGLPDNPSNTLSSDTVWRDVRPTPQAIGDRSPEATQPTYSPTTEIVEAQGWVINNKGEVVLVAQAPTLRPHRFELAQAACTP